MPTRRGPLSLLAVLLTTGLIAGCGGGDDKSGGGKSGGSSNENATTLLKKAFATEVNSGTLKVGLTANLQGSSQLKGPIKVSLDGPFKSQGKNKLPLLDWNYSFSGSGTGLSGKLITTGDNAFIGFRGQTYEVGKDQYKQLIDQADQNNSQDQKLSDYGIKPEDWLQDPKVSDGGNVGSDSTKKVTGSVDIEKMVRDIIKLGESSKVRKQLQRQGRSAPKVSDADIKKVTDAIQDPKFVVNVDDKNRLRKADFTAAFKVPKGSSSSSMAPTGGTINFVISLPEVDTDPTIKAPSGAKPLQLLLQQFGVGAGGLGGLKTN